VNGAAFRNFEEPVSLGFIEVAGQFDFTIDAIQEPGFGFAVPAIVSVNAIVLQPHGDAPEVDAFPLRVKPQRHRRAGA
jgi:hypothetical protein